LIIRVWYYAERNMSSGLINKGRHNTTAERRDARSVLLQPFVVCRARHVFLKVSQGYHILDNYGKSWTQPDGGEGCSGKQRGTGDGASEGSCPVETGCREGMG